MADTTGALARLVRAVDALPDGAFYRGKAHERVTDLPGALAAARKVLATASGGDGVNRATFGLERCEPSPEYPDGVRGRAGDPDLPGFAGDLAVEVSRLMEDTGVRTARVIVEWEGDY
jgi:hypothetical protein